MSKRNGDDPVTEKLCEAYRATIKEQIDGLKKTIIACWGVATAIIVIVQFILTLR